MGIHRPFGDIWAPRGKETSAWQSPTGNKAFFVHPLCNNVHCCSPSNCKKWGSYVPIRGIAHCVCHRFWFMRGMAYPRNKPKAAEKCWFFFTAAFQNYKEEEKIKRSQVFIRALLPEQFGLGMHLPSGLHVVCFCPRQQPLSGPLLLCKRWRNAKQMPGKAPASEGLQGCCNCCSLWWGLLLPEINDTLRSVWGLAAKTSSQTATLGLSLQRSSCK